MKDPDTPTLQHLQAVAQLAEAISKLERDLAAAQAEIERLREDAERYRYFRQWWCDDSKPNSPILDAMTPEETDAAIDKERRA